MRPRSLLAVALLVPGCASIVSSSTWQVRVVAKHPTEYEVFDEDGGRVATGKTPGSVYLPSGGGYFDGETYTFRTADGEVVLETCFNGWYCGNLLFGGLIGLLIVDPLTGAMWRLPESVSLVE